jgi:hypothetical protein
MARIPTIRKDLIYAVTILSGLILGSSAFLVHAENEQCTKQFPDSYIASGGPLDDGKPQDSGHITSFQILVIERGFALPSEDMQVTLTGVDNTRKYVLDRAKNNVYQKKVEHGRYVLRVSTLQGTPVPLAATPRYLTIDQRIPKLLEDKPIPTFVGRHPFPYFRMGYGLVPFEPAQSLVGISQVTHPPSFDEAKKLANLFQQKGIRLTPLDKSDGVSDLEFYNAKGAALIFELSQGADLFVTLDKSRYLVEPPARVGIPFDLGSGLVRLLDQFFLIKPKTGSQNWLVDYQSWLDDQKAEIYRNMPEGWNQIRLGGSDYCNNLLSIEKAIQNGKIEAGEPDLVLGFAPQWPNDKRYLNGQIDVLTSNHFRQKTRQSWTLLGGEPPKVDPKLLFGSIDDGIDPKEPEVDCAAPGLSGKLVEFCYDYAKQITCADAGYQVPAPLTGSHGLAVFGVMSACTDNNKGIAGVAPNVHHVAIRMPLVMSIAEYIDMLRWTVGLASTCVISGCPAQPPKNTKVPRIINLSQGLSKFCEVQPDGSLSCGFNLAQPLNYEAWVNSIVKLEGADYQIHLVYAAGNNSGEVSLKNWVAAPSSVLAVANCVALQKYDGTIVDIPFVDSTIGSNYGAEVDLCAIGNGSQTIRKWCGNSNDDRPCAFSGTSAAAASVTGTIALMLSKNQSLTWCQIRTILAGAVDNIENATGAPYGRGRLNMEKAISGAISPPTCIVR